MATSTSITREKLSATALAVVLAGINLTACGGTQHKAAQSGANLAPASGHALSNAEWMRQNTARGPQDPTIMNQRGKVTIPQSSSFEKTNRYDHERGSVNPMAPDENGDTATLITKDIQGNTRMIQPGRKKLFCFEGPDGETCVYDQLPTLRFGMEQRGIQIPSFNTSSKAGRPGHNYSPDRLESPNWW